MSVWKVAYSVVSLGGILGLANCTPVCEHLGQTCSASDWTVSIELREQESNSAADRFDVRPKQPIRLHIAATHLYRGEASAPAEMPTVEESRNGGDFALSLASQDGDQRAWFSDLLLPPRINDQDLGQLTVRVTVKDTDKQTVTYQPVSSGRHRVFRSPAFDRLPVQVLDYAMNPFGPTPVVGRTAVQVGSPIGGSRQIMITEQFLLGIEPRRWMDLYGSNGQGKLDYVQSSEWGLTRQQLADPVDAQLVLLRGSVAIYRTDSVTMRKDLTLLPLGGSRQPGLSLSEPKIPSDGKRLAGCAEESVVAISRPGSVLFFQTDAKSAKPAQYIGELSAMGDPVIATRDISSTLPSGTSKKYFAVLADAGGNVTLVELLRSGQIPNAVTSTPIGSVVTGGKAVSALALADLDSDGLQDIVLARSDGSIAWSPQHPDGSFSAATALKLSSAIPSGAQVTGLSVGDVVRDSAPDLAVATDASQVLIYSNQQ